MLKLSDFDYSYPLEAVAHVPQLHREMARLLVREENGTLKHKQVSDLPDEIPEGSVVIVNDSRVIASRIHGHLQSGAVVEILLLEALDHNLWKAIGKPLRKLKKGSTVTMPGGVSCTIHQAADPNDTSPTILVSFSGFPEKADTDTVLDWLERHGEMPLPPYINRKNSSARDHASLDRERYQTVYAKDSGSVAAPTAGLHWTPELMEQAKQRSVSFEKVTLHVGAGTFLPVKTSDINAHVMHEERFCVPRQTIEAIEAANRDGRKVIAVGTTTLRCLESLARMAGSTKQHRSDLADTWLRTSLYLRPQHRQETIRPWGIDAIQTNFHQPQSTLLMLVAALIGLDEVLRMYEEAIRREYRLFSYGDSSLLWLPPVKN